MSRPLCLKYIYSHEVRPTISNFDHAFAVPVYGHPTHLEECLESILGQSMGVPRILLGTSTPSPQLEQIASRYHLPLHINPQRLNIATDWNFVMRASNAHFVTIAHQDDVYEKQYLSEMAELVKSYPHFVIAFSNYREHTNEGPRRDNVNLKIKRLLCERAFRGQSSLSVLRDKRRLLSLGNPICCPSVILNRLALPAFSFSDSLATNLDWDAWLRLAEQPGEFLFSRKYLLSKRVHPQSETSATIANRARQNEDRWMFTRFWPAPIAGLLSAFYALGYRANRSS